MEPDFIQVSKLDAAQQQLRTATRLWFYDTDPISAHSLAFAACEIIHAVSKAINPDRPGLLFDSELINPVYRHAVNRRFKASATFFKHADRDPHGTLEFPQGLTWSFIYYSIYGLQLCDVELFEEFRIFRHWIAVNIPEKLTPEGRAEFLHSYSVEQLTAIQALSKQDFFERCIESLRRKG